MKRTDMKKSTTEVREYVRKRIIECKNKGYKVKEIGELLDVSDDYVRHVFEQYRKNGNSLAKEKIRGRKVGEKRILSQEKSDEIKTAIEEHTPDYFKLPYSLWSREAIQELIELKLKIKMPLRTITLYLQRWGMTCQRPAKRATEQSAAKVKEFQEVIFPEIVSKAKKENGIILFGDETGICNQENYQRGFSPAGIAPVVKLPAKKERINMISAISRQGHCEFMCYRETMTQQLLIEFLGRLIASYDRKIFLILDNLKVHHGKMVAEWVEERKNRIELFFFPSYSPQLNPDEYLNNILKKDVHSGKLPHTKEQLEKKTQTFMNKISHQPEKISNLFLQENLSFIEGCFVA